MLTPVSFSSSADAPSKRVLDLGPPFVRPALPLVAMPPSSRRQIVRPATYMRSLSVAASTHMQKLIWVSRLPTLAQPTIASLTRLVSLSSAQNPCLRSLSSRSLSCNSYSISSVSSLATHSSYGSTAADFFGKSCLMYVSSLLLLSSLPGLRCSARAFVTSATDFLSCSNGIVVAPFTSVPGV